MELNLDKLKTRIVDKIKDDRKTISMLLEQETVQEHKKETLQTQVISSFSLYVSEKQAEKRRLCPDLTYLEVIALIQEQWMKEDHLTKESY